MARKSSGKSEDEKRRLAAIHAKSNEGGDRSTQARRAADAKWAKFYDELPKRTLAEIAKRQAERSPQARERDAKSTSASVIDPRSDRVELWMRDPLHHDLLGIDTKPITDLKPERPPRPPKTSPRHGDGQPKHAPRRPAKAAPRHGEDKRKLPVTDEGDDRTEQPTVDAVQPAPAGAVSAPPDDGKPTKNAPAKATVKKPSKKIKDEGHSQAKAKDPPESVQVPEGVRPPDPKAVRAKGFSMVAYAQARKTWDALAKYTHTRAQSPDMKATGNVDDRLRKMVLGARPTKDGADRVKAWDLDLDKGGMVLGADHVTALFNPNAPPLAERPNDPKDPRNSYYIAPTKGLPWITEAKAAFFLDLGKYLKELNPPADQDYVPIGDAIYNKKRVQDIANILRGPALVNNSRDAIMVVRQGNRAVALAPVLPEGRNADVAGYPALERYAIMTGRSTKSDNES